MTARRRGRRVTSRTPPPSTAAPTPAPDVRTGLARQSSLTSVAALVAVVTGLALDTAIAARFGAGLDSDAFVIAARLPLSLLAMFMVTANQALVPSISTWLVTEGRPEVSTRVTQVLLAVMVASGVLAVVMAVGARGVVGVLAPGKDDASLDLAADLARVFVIGLPLTAGCEVLRAYLNARRSFVAPALMTSALNVVAASVVIIWGDRISVVPWAYVAGLSVQIVVMLAAAWRAGLRFAPGGLRLRPETAAALRLCGTPLAGAGLNPLARAAEMFVASFLPAGAPTVLHYGNRLIAAIGGTVLFRSVIVTVVPRLTEAVARGRHEDVAQLTVLGTRLLWRLSLTLTVLMAALAQPGARLVFERGSYSAEAANLLGWTLAVYASSLVGSAVQRAFLAPFFARLDTSTPWRNTVYGVGVNLALLYPLLLVFGRGDQGVLAIAAAYSIAQYANVAHAWWRLRADFDVRLASLSRYVVTTALGGLLVAGLTAALAWQIGLYEPTATPLRLLVGLAVCGSVGLTLLVGLHAVAGRTVGRRSTGPRHVRG